MSEWPDAPRLRESLERLAAEADTSAKERGRELLEADPSSRIVALPLEPPDTPAHRRRPRWRPLAAVAAVLALVVAAAAVVQLAGDSSKVETDPAMTPSTDAPANASMPPPGDPSAPAPPLSRDATCAIATAEPRPFSVELGDRSLELGVTGSNSLGSNVIVLTAPGSWGNDAAQIRLGSEPPPGTAYYVPAAFTPGEAPTLLTALVDEGCGPTTYLVAAATAYDAAMELVCLEVPGWGFQGYAFVDPGMPPDACSLAHPVLLLGDATPDALAAWQQHLGCSSSDIREDDAGSLITTYEGCDSTLVHVDPATDDPWDATIDGLSARDFTMQVVAQPN